MNNDEIQRAINESGYKLKYIAQKLNMSRSTLYRKLNKRKLFTKEELDILLKILNIKGE